MGLCHKEGIDLYYDNKATIVISYNFVRRDRTKHVEVGRYFIKEKLNAQIFIVIIKLLLLFHIILFNMTGLKYVEVDRYFIKEKLDAWIICFLFVKKDRA